MAGVATVHEATLVPSKLEALKAWLPSQSWFSGDERDLEVVGQFRFVDPDGEVGLQTMLLTSQGDLYQVPLSYRDAPLEGAEAALICTMEHSVLGTRWVYDSLADPVYAAELLRTIVEADCGAETSTGSEQTPVEGSGAEGVELAQGTRQADDLIAYGPYTIHVTRHPDEAEPIGALGVLTAEVTVDGDELTVVLAELRAI
jgi:hypothetical protein